MAIKIFFWAMDVCQGKLLTKNFSRWVHFSVLPTTRVASTNGDGFGMENSNAHHFPALKRSPNIGRVEQVSVSPTFYELLLFQTKLFCAAIL